MKDDIRNFAEPAAPACHPTPQSISYAFGPTTLGKVLVAQSTRGVCAILLGDDERIMYDALCDAFPAAALKEDPALLQPVLEQVSLFIANPEGSLPLRLDVNGTPFQQEVWTVLCDIPPGATASYAEVARRVGRPAASRAVAGACAANLLAVAIPCHRVVHADGSISGYRWGVARKRALLEREARA